MESEPPAPEKVEAIRKVQIAEVKVIPAKDNQDLIRKDKEQKHPLKKAPRQAVQKKVPAKHTTKKSDISNDSSKLYEAKLTINQKMINEGQEIIKNGNNEIPFITADYSQIGFNAYMRKMKSLGGRMFIGDATRGIILVEVVLWDNGRTFEFVGLEDNLDRIGAVSLFRPRAIINETFTDRVIEEARKRFGNLDLRCAILLPLEKEAALLGALKAYLGKSSYRIDQFDLVNATYIKSGASIVLELTDGRLRDTGKNVRLAMTLTI